MMRYLALGGATLLAAVTVIGGPQAQVRSADPPIGIMASITPIAATQDEPPPLPPGEFCAHVAHDEGPAHACACHRECYMDDADPPQEHMQEDSHCRSYCRLEHCHCPVDDHCEVPKR